MKIYRDLHNDDWWPGMKQSVAWAPNRDMNMELKFKLDCTVGGLDKSPFGFSKLVELDIILKPYEDYPSYRSQRIFFTRAVTFNFNNLVYHEPEKGHMQLLSQEPKEMGSRDSLETVSARGTKQRDLCQRYEKYIKIWGARHEESWLMDTNDSSFTLPAIRDQIVLDQEEEPIADEMTDSEHAEEEPNKGNNHKT
ncbi:hypothetical protein Tco_1399972 [Tanacetum coccineum]